VFGKELPGNFVWAGVLLDETTTQALGLIFHELATNALKYRRGRQFGRRAQSRLVDRRERTRRTLALNWHEAGQQA
jgi:two-component sensor histidine kinase